MITIEYFGGNCVKISAQNQTAIIDPKRSVFGLEDLSTDGLVEINTERRFDNQISKSFLQIDGPGEYEVSDFSVRAFAANRQTDFNNELSVTNYAINVDDINLVVLGNVANDLSDTQLEELGVADILIIPVGGGGYTLDAKAAGDLVTKIEPKIVIPVHYAEDGLRYEVPQDDFAKFSNELGSPVVEVDAYKVKKREALPESLEIVKLKLKRK